MRDDFPSKKNAEDIVANEEATGVVMHKDSVWNQQWENFKNSKVGESGYHNIRNISTPNMTNKTYTWTSLIKNILSGISDLKIQYDESDNAIIKASRFLTEKLTDFAGLSLHAINCFGISY